MDGSEFVLLSKHQLKDLNELLLDYTPSTKPELSSFEDSAKWAKAYEAWMITNKDLNQQRNERIVSFLQIEFPDIDDVQLSQIKEHLILTQNNRVYAFLESTRFLVKSPFYLTGVGVYKEALWWSFFGVLISLIYYVGLANSNRFKDEYQEDIGFFDPKEVPSQIAKLIYAPVFTIVLLVGYHFVSASGESMVDLNVNKGLLVFSFLSGFYSGRVMKFLDKLKNLFFNSSSNSTTSTNPALTTTAPQTGKLLVNLALDESVLNSELGPDIAEIGFNSATVTALSKVNGASLQLVNPEDDQGDTFFSESLNFGSYEIVAEMTYTAEDQQPVQLKGTLEINHQSANSSALIHLKTA